MLQEYMFLIPETRGDNGSAHEQSVYNAFHNSLLALAGGFTEHALANGCWKDVEGNLKLDRSTPYIVATDDESAIIEIVRKACTDFGQSCIYFRYPDGSVVLIKPFSSIELNGARVQWGDPPPLPPSYVPPSHGE